MVDYFKRTELDKEFYDKYIKDRLPDKIFDMHIHITTDHIVRNMEADPSDWAFQCSPVMTDTDYFDYAKVFYPDAKTIECNALPQVSRGVDVEEGNEYLANLKRQGKVRSCCMLIDPQWTGEYTEEMFLKGGFDGFKPYPDFCAGVKGADISIFQFINREQFEILNKYKKVMVLHLPRPGRMPDDKNVAELAEVKEKYPDIKLEIAHCGRCFAINNIKQAYQKMGKDLFTSFHFDLAAVLNPLVIDFMLEHLPHDQLMYGTDLPIFLWHGRRHWTEDKYFNLVREDFPFNKHEEGAEAEAGYTFFLYEQLKNILDACDKYEGRELAEKIFYRNAINFINK